MLPAALYNPSHLHFSPLLPQIRNDAGSGMSLTKTKRDKSKSMPPNHNHLTEVTFGHPGPGANWINQPIGADAAQQDHVPLWHDDFRVGEGYDPAMVRRNAEDIAWIACSA